MPDSFQEAAERLYDEIENIPTITFPVSLPAETLQQLDAYADRMRMSRKQAALHIVEAYIEDEEFVEKCRLKPRPLSGCAEKLRPIEISQDAAELWYKTFPEDRTESGGR